MCGIIAAATEKSVGKLLVQGLYKMEYRGYDSAGVALHQVKDIAHLRSLGKVEKLESKMKKQNPRGKIGIAHTRWATHGKPSEENAHPHASKDRVFIVHNGIIENYIELKEQLSKKGYLFVSQTDSELIAHQLDFFLSQKHNMFKAMSLLKKKLQGAFAIAAMDQTDDSHFYLMRNKSPLLLGISDEGMFAASDPLALADITNEFVFLEDGDVVEASASEYKICLLYTSPSPRDLH